jgi:predicted RecB family nuclease
MIRTTRISPTAIAKASGCLHTWYLQCFGDPLEKREPDAGTLLMFERGMAYERQCVSSLPRVVGPTWDGKDLKAGFDSTLALMNEGHPWIYQGVLLTDMAVGFPDLLRKEESTSNLGNHTYSAVDVKAHKRVTKNDRYQLLGYAHLLESVLGYRPGEGGIWLNTGKIEAVDLGVDAEDFEALLSDMERIRKGALMTQGYRCSQCNTCEWIDHCISVWEQNENVCLLYGVTGDLARRFTKAGLHTWRDVARTDPTDMARRLRIKPNRAEAFCRHARARMERLPQVIRPATFVSDVPIHFYDIETFGQCVYLHGNIRVFRGERQEKQFLAKDPFREEQAWHQYLAYLAQDEEATVYCWADYEREFVHALWEKYGGNPAGWRHLEENLVDQCQFVKDHFALPVFSYGIKHVAPVFGFAWSADDAGGLNSEAWYKEWLEGGDETMLQKILRYNLDDVLAMEVIDQELRKVVP